MIFLHLFLVGFIFSILTNAEAVWWGIWVVAILYFTYVIIRFICICLYTCMIMYNLVEDYVIMHIKK
jgi:hypothetical protein